MQESEVFFIPGKREEPVDRLELIAQTLYKATGPKGKLNASAVVKGHVGEMGNDGTDIQSHIRPEWVRSFVDILFGNGASKVFFADSTPTYVFGKRASVEGHEEVARLHGFTPENIRAPFVVADGLGCVEIKNDRLGKVFIPQLFYNVGNAGGYAIVLSHFTGHELYAFGGALKNLGMGFVGKDTKAAIHHFRAVVKEENCSGCGSCIDACTHGAITYKESGEAPKKVAQVDQEDCYGCMGCLNYCKTGALGLNFGDLGGIDTPQKKEKVGKYLTDSLITAAKEVTNVFQAGRMLFVTDLTQMTVFCDCDSPVLHELRESGGEQFLANDIGYLSSTDPVALDKACIDLVQRQITESEWHKRCGVKDSYFPVALSQQIVKATELGMGNKEYKLVTLNLQ